MRPLSEIFDYTQINGERQLRLMRLSSRSLPVMPVETGGKTHFFSLVKGVLVQRVTPEMTVMESGELCRLLHGALTGSGDSPVYTPEQHRARYEALKPTEAQRERIMEAIDSVPDEHRQETSWHIAEELTNWCCDPTNLFDYELTVSFDFAIDYRSADWKGTCLKRSDPPYHFERLLGRPTGYGHGAGWAC
jgi:hypothetical protein